MSECILAWEDEVLWVWTGAEWLQARSADLDRVAVYDDSRVLRTLDSGIVKRGSFMATRDSLKRFCQTNYGAKQPRNQVGGEVIL